MKGEKHLSLPQVPALGQVGLAGWWWNVDWSLSVLHNKPLWEHLARMFPHTVRLAGVVGLLAAKVLLAHVCPLAGVLPDLWHFLLPRKLLCQRCQLFPWVLFLSQRALQHVRSSGSRWGLCAGEPWVLPPSAQGQKFKQTLWQLRGWPDRPFHLCHLWEAANLPCLYLGVQPWEQLCGPVMNGGMSFEFTLNKLLFGTI